MENAHKSFNTEKAANDDTTEDAVTEGASSGPVSTLPGYRKIAPRNTYCYNHRGRKATVSIQGETDSFGCEYTFYCDECISVFDIKPNIPATAECDLCKISNEVFPIRDTSEGMCGPVYYCCKSCIDKLNKGD